MKTTYFSLVKAKIPIFLLGIIFTLNSCITYVVNGETQENDGIYYDPKIDKKPAVQRNDNDYEVYQQNPSWNQNNNPQQENPQQRVGGRYFDQNGNIITPNLNNNPPQQQRNIWGEDGGTVVNINTFGGGFGWNNWGNPWYNNWNGGFGWNNWGNPWYNNWNIGFGWNSWYDPWYGWGNPWYNNWNGGFGWNNWGNPWNNHWCLTPVRTYDYYGPRRGNRTSLQTYSNDSRQRQVYQSENRRETYQQPTYQNQNTYPQRGGDSYDNRPTRNSQRVYENTNNSVNNDRRNSYPSRPQNDGIIYRERQQNTSNSNYNNSNRNSFPSSGSSVPRNSGGGTTRSGRR